MSKELDDFFAEHGDDLLLQPDTLTEYRDAYTGDRPVHEITVEDGKSPFIIVTYGDKTVIINPMGLGDHLSVDVHSFVGEKVATGGVMAMTNGRRFKLAETGQTSHGFPSAALIAVLVGDQQTT